MLALRLHPDRTFHLTEEPIPTPEPGEVLIRIAAVGLCGSDRHWLVDGGIGDALLDRPMVLGHEFSGVPQAGRFAARLVAVDPAIPCERCEPCVTGAANLCLDLRFSGHGSTSGALREHISWPDRCLYPLSDSVDPVEGALIEPLAIAVHAIDLAGPLDGATVAIAGCGPIGLLLVALARAAGARSVIATEPLPHRLAMATEYGATETIASGSAGEERAAVRAATSGRGVDVAFDASGEPEAVTAAIHAARPGGTVILVGIPSDDRTVLPAAEARRKGLTIKLSRRSTPDAFGRAVEIAQRRELDLAGLVSLRVPLAEAPRGFEALVNRSGLKVIVEP